MRVNGIYIFAIFRRILFNEKNNIKFNTNKNQEWIKDIIREKKKDWTVIRNNVRL